MRYLLPFVMALGGLAGGCAMSMPDTPAYTAPSPGAPAPGATFCSRSEAAARSLASAQRAGGWTLMSLGIGSTGGGLLTALINADENRRTGGIALSLGGIALGIAAYTLFMRAEASSRLAQADNLALLHEDDRLAWETCVRSKAAWAGSKSSADGISQEMLTSQERENRELREEIEELKKKAGSVAKPPTELPPPLAPVRTPTSVP